MTTRPTLLIVTTSQFGYHVDTYEWARNLCADYDVTFLSWDHGLPKVDVPGVRASYVRRSGGVVARNLRFRLEVLRTIRTGFDHVLVRYFPGVSLAHLAAGQDRLICDVRTAHVGLDCVRRWTRDAVMRLELATFRHKTIVSECLAGRLGLRNYHVVPLGGLWVPFEDKDMSALRLLYVGTLTGRRVDETVRGLGLFHARWGDRVACTYDIVGSGVPREIERIRRAVAEHGLDGKVVLHGYVPHDEVVGFIERCNVGLSYVPIEPYFECQPATKTYEYLLGGLMVVATRTGANASVVGDENGVLIDDTPEAVAEALERICRDRGSYDPRAVQRAASEYRWERVVARDLQGYLERLRPEPAWSGGAGVR